MRPLRYDPRESPTHRPFLETPGFLAYLPRALRWGFRTEVVSVAVLFGLVLGLLAPTWLGLAFIALFGGALLTWLLTVQARAIWGYGDAPRLDLDQVRLFGGPGQSMIEIGGAIGAVYAPLYFLSPDAARWFAWGAGALLPSLFALVAVQDSTFRALDPRRLARVALASGVPGWLLAALSAVVTERVCAHAATVISAFKLQDIAALMHLGYSSSTVGMTIVLTWVTAVIVHLHGHALHHHRERAGLDVQYAAADDAERASVSCDAAVERVVNAVAGAEAKHDLAAVEQWLALTPPDGVSELTYLHALWEQLLFHRLYPAAVAVAGRLVPAAARDKRHVLAQEVLTEAWRLSPKFEPGPAARVALLRAALTAGDLREVDRLGRVDAARWPDDAAVVELTYVYAGWLAERRNDAAGARALLATVLDREHALRPRIAALHDLLAGA